MSRFRTTNAVFWVWVWSRFRPGHKIRWMMTQGKRSLYCSLISTIHGTIWHFASVSALDSAASWPIVADACDESHLHTTLFSPLPLVFERASYTLYCMCQTKLWKCHLLDCVCARSDTVGQDVMLALSPSLTPYILSLCTTPRAAFLRSHAVQFFRASSSCGATWICVRITYDISLHIFHQQGDTYSLPPIKPLLTMSAPLLFPLLAPSYISLLTFCLPLLCSLSAFFSSSLPFSISTQIP